MDCLILKDSHEYLPPITIKKHWQCFIYKINFLFFVKKTKKKSERATRMSCIKINYITQDWTKMNHN